MMKPVPVGTRVRVVDAGPFEDAVVGSELLVHVVDNDGTFQGRDPRSGRIGGWLRWSQVEIAVDVIGFEFLKTQLKPETVRLLLAFDGTENLRLKHEVRDQILLSLPDLGPLVREEAERLASSGPKLKTRRPRPAPRPGRDPEPPRGAAEDELSALFADAADDTFEEE